MRTVTTYRRFLNQTEEYLITGDKKDFAGLKTNRRFNLTITGPTDFIEIVLPGVIKRGSRNL
jgi:hypothetical protein